MFKVNNRNTDENTEHIFLNTVSTTTTAISNITGITITVCQDSTVFVFWNFPYQLQQVM